MKIAILGDSISTQINRNAVDIKITKEDIEKEIYAFPTYYDIGIVIGGYEIKNSDVGRKIKVIPTIDDLNKSIGKPLNYNNDVKKVWWQYIEEYYNCEINPVCWSGSSYTSHEYHILELKGSYAWHNSQITKLGFRIKGSNERIAPDIIILYRGCNDMTHFPYSRITNEYFKRCDWKYPESDKVEEEYGILEAISITIKKIRKVYPNTKIVLATHVPFKRINCENFPSNNGFYNLSQLNKAIKELAEFFGCYTIDFDKCGITFENCYSEEYITDSLINPTHPNDKGHELMGRQAIYDLLYKLRIDK